MNKLSDVYDVYNRKMKTEGICGSITASTGGITSCGSFFVIEEIRNEDKDNKEYGEDKQEVQ